MQFSFSTGTFYHRRLSYSLDLARVVGFSGVELALGLGYTLRGLDGIARTVQAYDVPILSLHPPLRQLPGWPRSMREQIPRAAEVARRLGVPLCVAHTRTFSAFTSPRGLAYQEALRRGQVAAGDQVSIAIETSQYFRRRHRFPLDDLATLVRFAEDHGCGITLDTCHAGANMQDVLACYELVRPRLRNVHLSDVTWHGGQPRTHVMVGEGTLPLRALLATLARDGYSGLVTLELNPLEVGLLSRRQAELRLRQALDFLREATGRALTDLTRQHA